MQDLVNNLSDLLRKQFGKTVNLFDFKGYNIEEIKKVDSHYGTPGVYIWFENGKPIKVGKHNAGAGKRALTHLGVTYKKGRYRKEEVTISDEATLVLILWKNSWTDESYWEDDHCRISFIPWLLAIEAFLELTFRLEYEDVFIFSKKVG